MEAEAVISGALGGGYYRIKKIKKGNFLLHFFQKAGFFFIFNFLILAVIDKHILLETKDTALDEWNTKMK